MPKESCLYPRTCWWEYWQVRAEQEPVYAAFVQQRKWPCHRPRGIQDSWWHSTENKNVLGIIQIKLKVYIKAAFCVYKGLKWVRAKMRFPISHIISPMGWSVKVHLQHYSFPQNFVSLLRQSKTNLLDPLRLKKLDLSAFSKSLMAVSCLAGFFFCAHWDIDWSLALEVGLKMIAWLLPVCTVVQGTCWRAQVGIFLRGSR